MNKKILTPYKSVVSKARKKHTKIPTLLQTLNRAADRRELEMNSKKSLEWFRKNARNMVGRTQAQSWLIKQQRESSYWLGKKAAIGRMFTYGYNAKHRKTLPYFDRFPLIFYIGPAKGGFYGINLHYLPPKSRAILFDALLELSTTTKYSLETKLNMTYKLLKSSQKFKLFKPCFKHYLSRQMETRIVEIESEEWAPALFLPLCDFGSVAQSKVWSDSVLGL